MKKRPLILAALLALATTSLFADKLPLPGADWADLDLDVHARGWDTQKLSAVEGRLRHLRPTALVITQNGKLVAEWGDGDRKVNVYSVRKSILSTLFGIGVDEGRIALDRTLADLGIDDKEPRLTAEEKKATIEDLLTARSGVYHPAAYELGVLGRNRPARGSHPHGTFWYYNNFDFNVLGTIYSKLMGESVFDAVASRIAGPIGMSFTAADGELIHEAKSDHPAYVMRLSARDLTLFGTLLLRKGRWGDRQVLPAEWIARSTRSYSVTETGAGYGYLWWQPPQSVGAGEGAFFALGKGGQAVAVVPSRNLVVVETLDVTHGQDGISMAQFLELLGMVIAAAPAPAPAS
ncbi:MAG: class beta-lactamase-related serine hydrolase [Enterovirga sp.]|jgi:CubicO group peptidase (beta-lactamase class C family)|nr:class beta-lactamase-related serine hydrolase [Enterovirga sp.]